MTGLSRITTRNSSRSRVSRVDSRRRDNSSKKSASASFFSAIKNAFSGGSGRASNDANSPPPSLTKTRSRRLSSQMFMLPGDRAELRKQELQDDEEAERERRRATCMAIKMAKREPLAVQQLLVDCEFCNPPPDYGRELPVITPQFTADDNPGPPPIDSITDVDDERTWNVGLEEWMRIRDWWLTPTADAVEPHHLDPDIGPDKYYAVYDKMIHHTRPLKQPLNLNDILQLVKTGWITEGTWPAQIDPTDVWSDTDAEQIVTGKRNNVIIEPAGSGIAGNRSAETSANTSSMTVASQPQLTPGITPEISEPKRLDTPGSASLSPSPAPTPSFQSPLPHVQFNDKPHPRQKTGPPGMLPLERMQSGMSLKPTQSVASSLVSMTDSD